MAEDKKMLRILIILSFIGLIVFGFILFDYNNTKNANEILKIENYELKRDNDRLKDEISHCQKIIPNNKEE